MKHRVVALSLCLFVAGSALAKISTSGSAEIKVVPDQVEIAVGVQSVHSDLTTAKALNDQAMARMMDIARRHGIAGDQLKTDFISVEPEYEGTRRVTPVRYHVQRSLVIVSKDISRFEELLTALVGAGANHVHSVRFMTSKLREHRDEARRMAARAALEKARLLAESLGSRVGKVRTISEASDSWSSGYASWWGRLAGASQNVSQNAFAVAGSTPADGSLAGRISVTASVSVTFELE
jgi:uncharacterized protein